MNAELAKQQVDAVKAVQARLAKGEPVFMDREKGLEILKTKGNVTRVLTELGDNPTADRFVDAVNRRLQAAVRKETLSFTSFV